MSVDQRTNQSTHLPRKRPTLFFFSFSFGIFILQIARFSLSVCFPSSLLAVFPWRPIKLTKKWRLCPFSSRLFLWERLTNRFERQPLLMESLRSSYKTWVFFLFFFVDNSLRRGSRSALPSSRSLVDPSGPSVPHFPPYSIYKYIGCPNTIVWYTGLKWSVSPVPMSWAKGIIRSYRLRLPVCPNMIWLILKPHRIHAPYLSERMDGPGTKREQYWLSFRKISILAVHSKEWYIL